MLEIAPDYTRAEFGLAATSVMQGNHREALERIEEVLSEDPDNTMGLYSAAQVALYTRRTNLARTYCERLIERAPESGHSRYTSIWLGYIMSKAGETDQGRKRLSDGLVYLENQIAAGADSDWVRYDIASVHAARGDTVQALQWLKKAVDAGYVDAGKLSIDPLFDDLRDDAQFDEMVAKVTTRATMIRKEIEAIE